MLTKLVLPFCLGNWFISKSILKFFACNFILYQSEILSILGGLSATTKGTNVASNKLRGVESLLKKLLVSCQSFKCVNFLVVYEICGGCSKCNSVMFVLNVNAAFGNFTWPN